MRLRFSVSFSFQASAGNPETNNTRIYGLCRSKSMAKSVPDLAARQIDIGYYNVNIRLVTDPVCFVCISGLANGILSAQHCGEQILTSL
jgi:hypothetical protein